MIINTRSSRYRIGVILLLLGIVLATALAWLTMPQAGAARQAGAWECGPTWQVANRFGTWSADSDALGNVLPDGYLAVITSQVRARSYVLTLYSPTAGDLIVTMPYDQIAPEPGTIFPTGRFDPIGKPSLSYHGGQVKIVQGLWGGGGSNPDRGGRIYTWCNIVGSGP